jgi:hypothetical protein
VAVAVGVPARQDTTIVTEFAVESKVTCAVTAGPLDTAPVSYPCAGLHDARYACDGLHCATTLPPCEVSTVGVGVVEADAACSTWVCLI